MKKFLYILFSGMLLSGAACSTDNEPETTENENTIIVPEITGETPYKAISLGNNAQEKVYNNNKFALDLFKAIATETKENTCIAPITSITGLAMLAIGDDSDARNEILTRLGYTPDNEGLKDLTDFCRVMNHELPVIDSETTFRPANSLWLNNGLDASKKYADKINDTFYAEIFSADLYSNEGMEAINKWCALKTKNLISNFLNNPVDSDVALLSALYFNGRWTSPFDKDRSFEDFFKNYQGKYDKAVYMEQDFDDVLYYADNSLESVSLKFGNGNFRMILVLPSRKYNLADAVDNFSSTDFDNITKLSEETNKTVVIPRFEVSTKSSHLEIYKKLGFSKIFTSGIRGILHESVDPLYITNIQHETIVKVTEDGTEAAAVNGIMMDGASGIEEDKFILDRPFLYIIEEASTNTILFIGQITKL